MSCRPIQNFLEKNTQFRNQPSSISAAFRQHADDLVHHVIAEAGSGGVMDRVASVDLLAVLRNCAGNRDAPGGAGDAQVELPVSVVGFVPADSALFAVVC